MSHSIRFITHLAYKGKSGYAIFMSEKTAKAWDQSANWYDQIVGKKGHYYHEKELLPYLKNHFHFEKEKNPSLIDLGCGTGMLSNMVEKKIPYLGIDASLEMVKIAKKNYPHRTFIESDLTKPLSLKHLDKKTFTHAIFLLSLQNMASVKTPLFNAASALEEGGTLFIVLNHPCFRIPRQSSWGRDEKKQCQYRRIESYLSEQKIPITTHPGRSGKEVTTYSFHYPP